MDQMKKVCTVSIAKNALVLFFLLWILFMPWPTKDGGSILVCHEVLLGTLMDGELSIWAIFDVAFLCLWIFELVTVIINVFYAVRCLKKPECAKPVKMKKTFAYSVVVCALIFNFLAMGALFYIGAFLDFVSMFSICFLFVLFIAVIVMGIIGKKKSKKAFAAVAETAGKTEPSEK